MNQVGYQHGLEKLLQEKRLMYVNGQYTFILEYQGESVFNVATEVKQQRQASNRKKRLIIK